MTIKYEKSIIALGDIPTFNPNRNMKDYITELIENFEQNNPSIPASPGTICSVGTDRNGARIDLQGTNPGQETHAGKTFFNIQIQINGIYNQKSSVAWLLLDTRLINEAERRITDPNVFNTVVTSFKESSKATLDHLASTANKKPPLIAKYIIYDDAPTSITQQQKPKPKPKNLRKK